MHTAQCDAYSLGVVAGGFLVPAFNSDVRGAAIVL